jgi:hypothetical protein
MLVIYLQNISQRRRLLNILVPWFDTDESDF